MAKIGKEQIKRIYSLAAGSGMSVHSEDKTDDLHALLFAETGYNSITEMDIDSFTAFEKVLLHQMQGMPAKPKPKRKRTDKGGPVPAGMMTAKQQALAWRLIYQLCEFNPTSATAGERMCGAIKAILDITATVKAPFVWVDFSSGNKLIEQLKRYVRSAERKAIKEGVGSG